MATDTFSIDKLRYTKSGVELRDIALVDDVLDFHFGTARVVTVVKQSLKAGVTVPRGTAVDVTLAFTDDLPVKVFPKVPKAWEDVPIRIIAEAARKEPEILELMTRHESVETMEPREIELFTAFARKAGPRLGDVEVDAAFDATVNAHLLASR